MPRRTVRPLAHLEVVLPSPPAAELANGGVVEHLVAGDDAIDEDPRRHHGFRVEPADLDDLVDLGHGDACRGGHGGIEVPRATPVDEVAEPVGARRPDEREVAAQRRLQHVAAPVELPLLAAARRVGADAGRRVERGEAGAAGTHALDQRALRDELELDGCPT